MRKHLADLVSKQRCCRLSRTVPSVNVIDAPALELLFNSYLYGIVAPSVSRNYRVLCVVAGDDCRNHFGIL